MALAGTTYARCLGRGACSSLPGLRQVQAVGPRPLTCPFPKGLCFLWPLEGWLPKAVTALEPPRPLIKGQGCTRPTSCQAHGEIESNGVSGSVAAHKVCDSALSLQAVGEEPGAAHMSADSPAGQPESQAVLPQHSFLFLCAQTVFRGRASVWCRPARVCCGRRQRRWPLAGSQEPDQRS